MTDQDLRKILERYAAARWRPPLERPRRRRWWIAAMAIGALVAMWIVIV